MGLLTLRRLAAKVHSKDAYSYFYITFQITLDPCSHPPPSFLQVFYANENLHKIVFLEWFWIIYFQKHYHHMSSSQSSNNNERTLQNYQ